MKQLALTLASIFIIVIFFRTQLYRDWYDSRLASFQENFLDEMDNLEIETRRERRWGGTYSLTKQIKEDLGMEKDFLLLLPEPGSRYIKKNTEGFVMPEPTSFYYFSGLKATYANSKDVEKSKFGIYIKDSSFTVRRIKSAKALDELRQLYSEQ